MRVYLQRAGYSLQQDGTLTRPDETKRKEYFNAVIAEWTAFQNKGNHGFYTGGFEQLFRGYSEGILNSKRVCGKLLSILQEPATRTMQVLGLLITDQR